MTIRDGRDDVYDSGGGLKKIVTIVTGLCGGKRCNAFDGENAYVVGHLSGRFQQDDGMIGLAGKRLDMRYSVAAGLPRNRRFRGKRRSSEMNELARLRGSERYGACDDAVQDAFFKGRPRCRA